MTLNDCSQNPCGVAQGKTWLMYRPEYNITYLMHIIWPSVCLPSRAYSVSLRVDIQWNSWSCRLSCSCVMINARCFRRIQNSRCYDICHDKGGYRNPNIMWWHYMHIPVNVQFKILREWLLVIAIIYSCLTIVWWQLNSKINRCHEISCETNLQVTSQLSLCQVVLNIKTNCTQELTECSAMMLISYECSDSV